MPRQSSLAAKPSINAPQNAEPAPLGPTPSTTAETEAPKQEEPEVPAKPEAPKGFFARLWAWLFGG